MSPSNRRLLVRFFLSLLATMVAISFWDVHLYRSAPDGEDTISWAMAQLGPGGGFLVGFGSGATIFGLAAHFWFGQMKPAEWAELKRLRAEAAARGRASATPGR